YAALYPPTLTRLKPSAELHRRVAELTARQPARAAFPTRAAGWSRFTPIGWQFAAAALLSGVVLVTLLSLSRVRPGNHPPRHPSTPSVVRGVEHRRPAPAPQPARHPLHENPVPPNRTVPRLAVRRPMTPPVPGEAVPAYPRRVSRVSERWRIGRVP